MTKRLIKYSFILSFLILFCTGCGEGYEKWNGKIYYTYWTGPFGLPAKKNKIPLEGADYKSFKTLHKEWTAIGKDKNQVYKRNTPISGIDAQTFQILKGEYYMKDKNHIYIYFNKVDTADAATFELMSKHFAKDKNHIFYEGKTVLPEADITSFDVVNTDKETITRDKNHYYLHLKKMNEVDYNSFTLLSQCYAKDKYRVYYLKGFSYKEIKDADPATFQVLNNKLLIRGVAKDKNNYFVGNEQSTKEKVDKLAEKNWFDNLTEYIFD